MARALMVTEGGVRTDDWAESLALRYVNDRHYRANLFIGGEDVDVLKPDGTPLLMFRTGVIPRDVCLRALPALDRAARPSDNRGAAAGLITKADLPGLGRVAAVRGSRLYRRKRDGRASRTSRAKEVLSGTVGFYDREPRLPVCRATAFTAQDVEGWRTIKPFIRAVNDVFREVCPDRYAAQMRAVARTPPEYVIRGTAFTTVTVNKNWRTAVHQDANDLPEGFGVMAVVEGGERYEGGYLVFPQFGVAVDMRTTDVLLADVHQWHGNTEITSAGGKHVRLSTVMYFRAGMVDCLPFAKELARAQTSR